MSAEKRVSISFKTEQSKKELVEQIAKEKGITVTDYLDSLIVKDLEESAILNSLLALQSRQDELAIRAGDTADFMKELLVIINGMSNEITNARKDAYLSLVMQKETYSTVCDALSLPKKELEELIK